MDRPTDFFISYTGKDRAWAEWIAWILEEHGYTTLIQAWDFNAASNFILKMQSGTADSARTVAVITPDYFQSAFTQPEWAAAFACDPKSEMGKLIAIRVADFNPPGLFKSIVYIDLVALEESSAKEILTKSIDGIVAGKRLKPDSQPAFPGAKSAIRPHFPGTPVDPKRFLHNLPFAPNPFFTGREKMLEDLREALRCKTSAAITQPHAVHGLGGVGKTQLAIEYAWRHQTEYDAILWAGASSLTELHANVATLATILRLPESEEKEQATKVRAVINWLRTHQRWLLIVDNVDSEDTESAVTKLLPPDLLGHVIVTSRRSDWPLNFADMEVTVLAETAAVEFLLKRARKASFNPGNDVDALAVARELGCLPLALEQAGAYIAKHRETLLEYLNLLKDSRARLLKFPSQGGTGYQQTVATTWLVSEQQLSIAGRIVLQLTSFLAPQNIPKSIFAESEKLLSKIAEELFEAETESSEQISKEMIQDAIGELHDHSLISLEPNMISCHRLLQAVLLDRLESSLREEWLDAATILLADAAKQAPPNPTNWPLWRLLQPQIESVLKHQKNNHQNPAIPFLMTGLAEYYEEIGDYPRAETLMRISVETKIASGADLPEILAYKVSLAHLLCITAQFDEAENLSKEIIGASKTETPAERAVFTKALTVLAKVMEEKARFAEAEELHRQILNLIEKDEMAQPIDLAGALNNCAHLMLTTRRFAEAETLFRRSLIALEKDKRSDNSTVATILGNLAHCLHEQGNLTKEQKYFDEAERLYRRAMEIDEDVFGNEHPFFARDTNNLGWFLHSIGKLDEAEALIKNSLRIEESKRHKNHPAIATSLSNLGRLLTSRKRFNEAKEVFERARQINLACLGKNQHDYATVLTNLAFALIGNEEFDKAEACFKEALAIDEECFGKKHPEVGGDLWNLGSFLIPRKRYIEAEGFLRRALKIFETRLGTYHLQTRNIQGAIEFARTARLLDGAGKTKR